MELQGTVLGIPAQTLMDAFLLIINKKDSFSHIGKYRPTHCKNIAFYATSSRSLQNDDMSYICRPVDSERYPNWQCVYDGGDGVATVDVAQHAFCGRRGFNAKTVFYCACQQGTFTYPDEDGVRTVEYYIEKEGIAEVRLCSGCKDSHGKIVVCENCGQVH